MAGSDKPGGGGGEGGEGDQDNVSGKDNRTLKNYQKEDNRTSNNNQNNRYTNQTYAERLKTNVKYDQRLKRNVLEITLEKTEKDAEVDIEPEIIARVFKTIGIEISNQVEGYQVHFKGQTSVISVWLAAGIDLEKFCRDDNIKVSRGIMTGVIRPAGRKDVTVTISGLDFNTPDTFVFNYLSKFGKLMNQSVIYSKFTEGPFRGKFNGERKYNVDFSDSSRPMGTFHIIDGAKVRVFYRGNKKTCGRCHKFSADCPGDGLARDCEAAGGDRVNLSDMMKELWEQIRFTPEAFELGEEENKAFISDKERFPRFLEKAKPQQSEVDKYRGFTVKNFPTSLTDEEIKKFLVESGVSQDESKTQVNISRSSRNASATIEGIEPVEVTKIIEAIDFPSIRTKFFNVPLYCRPLRIQTPEKESPDEKIDEAIDAKEVQPPAPAPPPSQTKEDPPNPVKINDSSKEEEEKVMKTSPASIVVGGVKFQGFENSDLDDFKTPTNTPKSRLFVEQNGKRSAATRSPLDHEFSSDSKKAAKKLKNVKVTPVPVK